MLRSRESVSVLAAVVLSSIVPFGADVGGQQVSAKSAADLVIEGVNVVDVREGRVLRDHRVVIDGGVIRSVTPAGRDTVPTADERIDGSEAYLIPGLWDLHAHLRGSGVPPWFITDWYMPLLVAHGVTGVRDMNSACDGDSDGPICLETMREWQARIREGELPGPRILALSSFMLNPPWDYEVSEEQARTAARMFADQDLDFIKVYDRLGRDAFFWLMDEANTLDIEVAGHVPLRVTSTEASNAGVRSIEHARAFLFDCYPGSAEFRDTTRTNSPSTATLRAMVDRHDPEACEELFRTLDRNRTWYVPTHVTRRMEAFAGDSAFRNDPRTRYVPPPLMGQWIRDADGVVARDSSVEGRRAYRDFYRKGLAITGAAHEAGVAILVGTDAGDSFVFPGSSVHDELGELAKAGLSPAEALRAATWKGAEFLGLTERHGSVDAGKQADLVLLSDDPLVDIENVREIRAVVLDGRYMDRERLDALLEQAESTAAKAAEGGDEP